MTTREVIIMQHRYLSVESNVQWDTYGERQVKHPPLLLIFASFEKHFETIQSSMHSVYVMIYSYVPRMRRTSWLIFSSRNNKNLTFALKMVQLHAPCNVTCWKLRNARCCCGRTSIADM